MFSHACFELHSSSHLHTFVINYHTTVKYNAAILRIVTQASIAQSSTKQLQMDWDNSVEQFNFIFQNGKGYEMANFQFK